MSDTAAEPAGGESGVARTPPPSPSSILGPERWHAAAAHLEVALEVSGEARQAWLGDLESRDPIVAGDVRILLGEYDAVARTGFLELHDDAWPWAEATPAIDWEPGTRIGPYRLVRLLGEGGMGAVWRAEQDRPIHRAVAIKVVRSGRGTLKVLSRFDQERQALAVLNHPNIARIFDAGVAGDGRPYFVMEYVEGLPITAFADRHALSVDRRLRLFLQICEAVQHAHQKGLLHRDLKPANILAGEPDGQPVVKIIDFGIAKPLESLLADEAPHTEFGVLVGTPEYMSPEQAGLIEAAVDARTDVYSLGLVLYELLAGSPPFGTLQLRQQPVFEALRIIREEEPARLTSRLRGHDDEERVAIARARGTEPRVLLQRLEGELEWITSRTLQKDPALRYASASELRADIERHLGGEPVLAGQPSTLYRLSKLARRHRAVTGAIVAGATAITTGAIVSTVGLVQVRRAEDAARRQLISAMVSAGMQKVDEADPLTGLVYLTRALELETDQARTSAHRVRLGETLQRSPRLVHLWRHDASITMLALSSRGLVVTGSTDGVAKVRDLVTGRTTVPELRQGAAVVGGGFWPDGRTVAVLALDGRLRLWDAADGRLVREIAGPDRIADASFSRDSAAVATIDEGGALRVTDVATGTHHFAAELPGPGAQVLFSRTADVLAAVSGGEVRAWRGPTWPQTTALRWQGTDLGRVALSADGRWIATAGRDWAARLWDVASGWPVGEPMRHDAGVDDLMFSDDGALLVTTAYDHTTRLWQVPEATVVGRPRVSASIPGIGAVGPTRIIASPTQGGLVDLWGLDGQRAMPSVPHAGVDLARFDLTGRFLVTAGRDGIARLWDLAPAVREPPRLMIEGTHFAWRVVAAPDGRTIALTSGANRLQGVVRVMDAFTGAPVTPTMRLSGLNIALAFSPDGRCLVTSSEEGTRLWDVASGEPLTTMLPEAQPMQFAAFAPDGATFVVADDDGAADLRHGVARIRAAVTGADVSGALAHDAPVMAAYNPDGRFLVTAARAGSPNLKMWDVRTGRLLWTATHPGGIGRAIWDPNGRTLYTGGLDQQIRRWRAASGEPLPHTFNVLGGVWALDVSPDGGRLIAGTDGGNLQTFDLSAGTTLSAAWHRGFVYQSRLSPDGTLALTSAGDQTARLWDGRTGEPLTPGLWAGGQISRGATMLDHGRAWAWTGAGVFVDELTTDDQPVERLRAYAEGAAGRTLGPAGTELVLSPSEAATRFAEGGAGVGPSSPLPATAYERAEVLAALRQGRYDAAVALADVLRSRGASLWPDEMRRLTALAGAGRWHAAIEDLRHHRKSWTAAPELMYVEAVALARLGDGHGGTRLCREALNLTRETRQPERAYWAARACLAATTVAEPAEIEDRLGRGHAGVPGTFSRDDLRIPLSIRVAGQSRARRSCASWIRNHRATRRSPCARSRLPRPATGARRVAGWTPSTGNPAPGPRSSCVLG